MIDRDKVIEALEKCKRGDCDECTEEHASHCPWDCIAHDELVSLALALLKEQDAWIEQIADYQQSITGSGMHELTEYEQGKWDGLQIAWNIISEGR